MAILQDLDDIVNQAREAQELEPVDVFFADDKILQKQFRQTAIFNRYLYNFFYDLHLISVYKCIRIREIHLLFTYMYILLCSITGISNTSFHTVCSYADLPRYSC